MCALHNLIIAYIFKETCMCIQVCLGTNNLPALHSTGFIRCVCITELLWIAGMHEKALPLNAEHRAHHFIWHFGGPNTFYERNHFNESTKVQNPIYTVASQRRVSFTCLPRDFHSAESAI